MTIINKVGLLISSYVLNKDIDTSQFGFETSNESLINLYKILDSVTDSYTEGSINYRNQKYPILSIKKGEGIKVLILAGIHGNESSSYTIIHKLKDILNSTKNIQLNFV